jgi:transcriptional regulator with XRE-family HTH domain
MDLREVFAKNLRQFRRAVGLSQEELADATHINRTYISKLETARTYAGLEIIGKLSKVLGIEPHELLVRPTRKPSSGKK